ncbi:MAG: hypothetical protein GY756_10720 [bacterium]|nr:hypothetical protein [bacterium]
MDTEKYQKWTEHNWEEELRREDAKVNAYLNELPLYLDLPNEEAMIFNKLNEKNILLRDLPIWEDMDLDLDFMNEFSSGIKSEDSINSKLYYSIGSLSTDINIFASIESSIPIPTSINLLYLFGKLMSLQVDITQTPNNDLPNLKTALQKRQISIINKIIGILNSFDSIKTVNSKKLEKHISNTHKLRNIIIDSRFNHSK